MENEQGLSAYLYNNWPEVRSLVDTHGAYNCFNNNAVIIEVQRDIIAISRYNEGHWNFKYTDSSGVVRSFADLSIKSLCEKVFEKVFEKPLDIEKGLVYCYLDTLIRNSHNYLKMLNEATTNAD